MARKNKKLPGYIKLWWLLNGLAFIHVSIQLLDHLSNKPATNNFFIHAIYNLTSVFVIIPYYLMLGVNALLYGLEQTFNSPMFLSSYLPVKILIGSLLLSLLTNLLISKIAFSKPILSFYNLFINPYPILKLAIPAIIIFLFITG